MESKSPQVVILCGGLGMRLREEAEHKPKAMVEVGGRPILWHIMRHYQRFGFHRFVLCLGYKGEKIREYFLNYEYMNYDLTVSLRPGERKVQVHRPVNTKDEIGWEVTLVETGAKAMTGARMKRIERYIDGDFFLATYGDGVSNVDLHALLNTHQRHGKVATITGVSPISRFGTLVTEGDQVTEFTEKPALQDSLINGGFFVFDRRMFSYLSDDDSCVLEHEPFHSLARDGEMMTYRHEGYWHCMDTPRDVQQLNEEWNSGNPGWLLG